MSQGRMTTKVIDGCGSLRLRPVSCADVMLDFSLNEAGEQIVSLGSPYSTTIVIAAKYGKRRLVCSAPQTVKIEQVKA